MLPKKDLKGSAQGAARGIRTNIGEGRVKGNVKRPVRLGLPVTQTRTTMLRLGGDKAKPTGTGKTQQLAPDDKSRPKTESRPILSRAAKDLAKLKLVQIAATEELPDDDYFGLSSSQGEGMGPSQGWIEMGILLVMAIGLRQFPSGLRVSRKPKIPL